MAQRLIALVPRLRGDDEIAKMLVPYPTTWKELSDGLEPSMRSEGQQSARLSGCEG